jgi:hypothetical protein
MTMPMPTPHNANTNTAHSKTMPNHIFEWQCQRIPLFRTTMQCQYRIFD